MHNTKLKDRVLWFDGDMTVDPKTLEAWVASGKNTSRVFVSQMTDEIKRFNKFVGKDKQITIKETNNPLNFSWNLPEEYQNLDVGDYVGQKFIKHFPNIPSDEITTRTKRIVEELNLYEKMGLINVLRAIIYIINTLESKNVVWGVGRGSSVSSYVLYLIGVHDVDSVAYNLDINDFLHT